MNLRVGYWLLLLWLPFAAAAATPDLVLQDLDGKARNVKEYIGRGKWTVVAVWSADCPICKREIFHMTFFHDEHKGKDAEVLGLSIDGYGNKAKALAFIKDQSLNFPNLIGGIDAPTQLSGTLFIGTPTYYIFSPQGKFMTQRIGPVTQEDIEAILSELKTRHKPKG